MTQFEQPHELLNAYIAANLRVKPIDKPARAGTTSLKKASRDLRTVTLSPRMAWDALPTPPAKRNGPRPLTDLFLFSGITPDWAMQTAKLVCVTRQGTNASRIWKYRSSFRQAGPEDACITDSPKWAHQRSLEPFCEASKFSTADLLFVLRLANGQCLHIAVATMLHNAHVQLSIADIEERLENLAPSKLFPPNLAPATARPLSLPHLGREASAAANPSLLRVVCTFPYEVDINTVEHDGHAQPIAAINVAAMREIAGSLKADDVARRLLGVLTGTGRRTAKRKDRKDGDEEERPRKRPKSMAILEQKDVASSLS
uniref:Uncharacterized protein n=1 Tax=Schizophyllum commune (strain H4-8 / FGSC 9210) TaxID=578458 RepID=D8Q6Y3_SCHCM